MLISSEIFDSVKESFLCFVRAGLGQNEVFPSHAIDWQLMKALADEHGVSAVVLDGIERLMAKSSDLKVEIPKDLRRKWIAGMLKNHEGRYRTYKHTLASLAGFYNMHGFKMMVLKGYACSLDWPQPNHRPCGDIDIWQFGQWKEADAVLAAEKNVKIGSAHHHHTVFRWNGFSVENHYDFLNVHHHKSNVEMEAILKRLGQDDSHYTEIEGEKVYLPSANLHALFMLRHGISNFASTGFKLRQLLDWAFLVQKHNTEIDWQWLEKQVEYFGMKKIYDIFNAICIEDLGFDSGIFPKGQFDPSLKERVLNDVLSNEFSEKESGGFLSRALYKFRRWKANAWKHRLCFKESMWSAFLSGVWSHLLKPKSV